MLLVKWSHQWDASESPAAGEALSPLNAAAPHAHGSPTEKCGGGEEGWYTGGGAQYLSVGPLCPPDTIYTITLPLLLFVFYFTY